MALNRPHLSMAQVSAAPDTLPLPPQPITRPLDLTSMPDEILLRVGYFVPHRNHLKELVKVNRQFHGVYTSLLYKDYSLLVHRYCHMPELSDEDESEDEGQITTQTAEVWPLVDSWGLSYTQSLELQLSGNNPEDWYVLPVITGIIQMINKMNPVKLNTIKCIEDIQGHPMPNSWRNIEINHVRHLFDQFKKIPNLHHLHIQCHQDVMSHVELGPNDHDYHELDTSYWFKLDCYANLVSLELYGFLGSDKRLLRRIAKVLGQATKLEKLGLARCRSNFAVEDEDDDDDGSPLKDNWNHVEIICFYYKKLGFKPLKLKTLRLGNGFYLSSSISNTQYLVHLLELPKLKTLHLGESTAQGRWSIYQFDVSIINQCVAMTQLSLPWIRKETIEWLNRPACPVEELLVAGEYNGNQDEALTPLRSLKVPHLSTLSFDLTFIQQAEHLDTEQPTILDIIPVMSYLASSQPAYNQTKRLCMNLDLDSQWRHLLAMLPKLHSLTELRLTTTTTQRDHTTVSSTDPFIKYAYHIQEHCLSLQIIMIAQWTWRVRKHEIAGEDGRLSRVVKLELLSQEDETLEEICMMGTRNTQCGLLEERVQEPRA